MAEEGSIFGSAAPIIEAPVVQAPVVEVPLAPMENTNNEMRYSTMSAGDTRSGADTIAESQASKEQLLGMFNEAAAKLGQFKGASIPMLASFDKADIQAALNAAQANLDAEEAKKIQKDMMKGFGVVAGDGKQSFFGDLSNGNNSSDRNAPKQGEPYNPLNAAMAVALLKGEKPFNLGTGFSDIPKDKTPEQYQVAANLPGAAVSSKKNVDLTGQGELGRVLKGDDRAVSFRAYV